MASSEEPKVETPAQPAAEQSTPAPVEPAPEAEPAADAELQVELTPIQAAMYGIAQQFLQVSKTIAEEARACGLVARKGPDETLRLLPRHVASALTNVARAMERVADFAAATGDVEARVAALEAEDDIHGVVGSVDDLMSFLEDVLALCEAFTPYALTDEHKELLDTVKVDATDMLARARGEEPADESAEEPAEEPSDAP